jgi:hypothetical protein
MARATDMMGNVRTDEVSIIINASAPLLILINPENGTVTGDPVITVSGFVKVGALVKVNGEVATVTNGTFNQETGLIDGPNAINVEVKFNGDETKATRTVFLDREPPEIIILRPEAGAYMNSSLITVAVHTNEEATVYVLGEKAAFIEGEYITSVSLSEGLNSIQITARDVAGNVNTVFIVVGLDTVPPQLTVLEPIEPVLVTKKKTMVIKGTCEAGANLTINGEPVIVEENGTFVALVKLKVGENSYVIVATDEAGNTQVMEVMAKRKYVEDNSWVSWLLVFAIIAAAVSDGAIIYYFKKIGPKKIKAKEEEEEESEEPEEKAVVPKPRLMTRQRPSTEQYVDEVEFEEVSMDELEEDEIEIEKAE